MLTFLRRHWLILLALVIVLLSALGIAGAVWWGRRQAPKEAHALFQRGQEALAAGRAGMAMQAFLEAARVNPKEPRYLLAAAQAASQDGKAPEARTLARQAWDAGLREPAVLLFLLADAKDEDRAAARQKAERLVAGVTDRRQRLELDAVIAAEYGSHDEIRTAWRALLAVDPALQTTKRYIAILSGWPEPDDAEIMRVLEAAVDRLDADGYEMLAMGRTVSAWRENQPERAKAVLALFDQARTAGVYGPRLRQAQALHLWVRHQSDAALQVLQAPVSGTDADAALWQRRGRLLEALILSELGRGSDIPALGSRIQGGGRESEGELLLYRTLGAADRTAAQRVPDIEKALRLMGDEPLLSLLLARAQAESQPQAALTRIEALPSLLAWSPAVLLDRASLAAALGRADEAQSLLGLCHRLHGVNRRSLLLMGALTVASGNEPGLQRAVQDAFVQVGKKDPGMLAAGAEYALRRGDYAQAATAFADLHQQAPGDPYPALGAARVALAKGDWRGALTLVDGNAAIPAEARAGVRGLALHGLGEHQEALKALSLATAAGAHPPGLDLAEADAALQTGDAPRAAKAAAKAAAALPKEALPQELLARAALAQNDGATALQAIDRALALKPDPLRRLLRAQALALLRRLSEALTAVGEVRRTEPDRPDAALLEALLQLESGKPKAAHAILLKLDRVEPNRPWLGRLQAEAELASGEVAAAQARIATLVTAVPAEPAFLLLEIRALAAAGTFDQARAKVAALPPAVTPARRALALAAVERLAGRPDQALAALAPQQDDPQVAVAWASTALAAKEAAPVAPVLARHRLDGRTLAGLAAQAERAGRWSDAAAITQQALQDAPSEPALLNNWAWYALHDPAADRQAVVAAAVKAQRALPAQPGVLDTFAEVHLWAGKPGEVVTVLGGIPDLVRRHPQLAHGLGRAQAATGDIAGARTSLKQALELAQAASTWPLRESEKDLRQRITALR